MRWDAHEIARFARGAGFVGDDVTTATALALATSGGVASYDVHAGLPGAGHWVGLWGVNIDKWPPLGNRDLHVPQWAARAAKVLHEAHDGWHWSPTYTSGQHLAHVEHAGTARTREYDYQAPALPFTFPHTDELLRQRHTRLANRAAQMSQAHNLRRG
ncbi:MAG TPA: hypothetical protein VFO15_18015 [Xanthobacteraceae bacterium]|nr:hypothetical protein [Xanthobacteraceae bacterium]